METLQHGLAHHRHSTDQRDTHAITQVDVPVDILSSQLQPDRTTRQSTLNIYSVEVITGTKWIGTSGNDVYNGSVLNDVLDGRSGADTLYGDAGNDSLIGGPGKDSLNGGTGTDLIDYSTRGAGITVTLGSTSAAEVTINQIAEDFVRDVENVTGSALNDYIVGDSQGNDLPGGAGSDWIGGGAGKDTLLGQAGSDTFVFSSNLANGNADKIADFDRSQDWIALEKTIFSSLGAAITSPEFRLGTKALDGNDFLIYDRPTGNLYYDSDGNGCLAKVLVASLTDDTALYLSDFILI